jgi:hypothetical protein
VSTKHNLNTKAQNSAIVEKYKTDKNISTLQKVDIKSLKQNISKWRNYKKNKVQNISL